MTAFTNIYPLPRIQFPTSHMFQSYGSFHLPVTLLSTLPMFVSTTHWYCSPVCVIHPRSPSPNTLQSIATYDSFVWVQARLCHSPKGNTKGWEETICVNLLLQKQRISTTCRAPRQFFTAIPLPKSILFTIPAFPAEAGIAPWFCPWRRCSSFDSIHDDNQPSYHLWNDNSIVSNDHSFKVLYILFNTYVSSGNGFCHTKRKEHITPNIKDEGKKPFHQFPLLKLWLSQ